MPKEMKPNERPIIFSTPMVKAILEGRKTQTRRILNPQPEMAVMGGAPFEALKELVGEDNPLGWTWKGTRWMPWPECIYKMSPYGEPGDLLYVRETFANGSNHLLDSNIGKAEKDFTLRYWLFKDGSQLFSDGEYFPITRDDTDGFGHIKWKPSIHMPKAAARIWLEVESIDVEPLQDISEQDAIAEGVLSIKNNYGNGPAYCDYFMPNLEDTAEWFSSPINSYKSLWNQINGPDSWDANPWVWKITFKRFEISYGSGSIG